jgi:hypothetical protein
MQTTKSSNPIDLEKKSIKTYTQPYYGKGWK